METRIRQLYLHHWMWYYNNKIGIDEYCRRLRRMDALFNKDSKYYTIYHPVLPTFAKALAGQRG